MNEADLGRVLPASLHQGITDVLPSRVEFYESWLNPKAMRDGRIGLAPLNAVLSFLRLEGAAYQAVSARSGEYAADWLMADLSGLERRLAKSSPLWLRRRLAGRLVRRLILGTYRPSHVTIRWRKGQGTIAVSTSLFCIVREPVSAPLCEYYVAASQRLLAQCDIAATVSTTSCRGMGDAQCVLSVSTL